jgi:hypothetical protein
METGRYPGGPDGDTLKRKVKASGVSRVKLWPAPGQFEVCYAYNVITAEVASAKGLSKTEADAWKAQFGNEWVTGQADYVSDLFGRIWVEDLKTGRYADFDKHKYQQRFYLLCATVEATGGAADGLNTILHWPKYPLAEPPVRTETRTTVQELVDLVDRLVSLREARAEQPRLVPGEQCRWCPSAPHCPEDPNTPY